MSAGPVQAECRSCHAAIVWATTPTGRQMPLDAKPEVRFTVQQDSTGRWSAVGVPTYISHFATCPNADQHRKKDAPR